MDPARPSGWSEPHGRLRIADVVIQHDVSEDARKRIDRWTG
jgi:hypothetical protein